jgi:hypothetical protein
MPDALEPLAPDLWGATRPLPLAVGDVGARMTVVRLAGGDLVLISPVRLDAPTREAVDRLGRVRWLVGPNRVHHLFLGDWARAHPEAELCAAPGLERKRRDLDFRHVLEEGRPVPWASPDLAYLVVEGAPILNEVVFLHRPTRTLVLTDLAFNLLPGAPNRARIFHRLVGATGRFGPHRLVRLGLLGRRAARRSIDRILEWDFDRVIVAHGAVLESDGRRYVREAFAFLPS